MISTPTYYRVCELSDDLVIYRKGKLLWHDLRFMLDCVHDTDAKPWIMLPKFQEEFEESFRTMKNVIDAYQG